MAISNSCKYATGCAMFTFSFHSSHISTRYLAKCTAAASKHTFSNPYSTCDRCVVVLRQQHRMKTYPSKLMAIPHLHTFPMSLSFLCKTFSFCEWQRHRTTIIINNISMLTALPSTRKTVDKKCISPYMRENVI